MTEDKDREHTIAYHMNKLIGYHIEIDKHISELARIGVEVMYSDSEQVGYYDDSIGDYKTFYKKL